MHFYTKDGKTAYEVQTSDGKKTRPTTVRDARKNGWVPSVTTVISQIAKPGLDYWKQTQLLDVVENNPDLIGKSLAWKENVIQISNKENSKYSEAGTKIHDKLEKFYKTYQLDESDRELLLPVIEAVGSIYKTKSWEPEKSFVSKEGFGGKIDMWHADGYIIDFKTKTGPKVGKSSLYKDYAMQLAAYRRGTQISALCYNIVISSTHPGEIYIHKWSEEELEVAEQQFMLLLEYWKLTNNYRSEH